MKVKVFVLLFQDQKLDLLKFIFLKNTLKAARLIIGSRVMLNYTNRE